MRRQVPNGLGVRIPDSHSGGPGSIPGSGGLFGYFSALKNAISIRKGLRPFLMHFIKENYILGLV